MRIRLRGRAGLGLAAVAAALGAGLFCGGYVLAQQQQPAEDGPTSNATMIVRAHVAANTGPEEARPQPLAKLMEAYGGAARSDAYQRAACIALLHQYYSEHQLAQNAPQAAQVANETSLKLQLLQVAQNQRIIGLLEQIAAKK